MMSHQFQLILVKEMPASLDNIKECTINHELLEWFFAPKAFFLKLASSLCPELPQVPLNFQFSRFSRISPNPLEFLRNQGGRGMNAISHCGSDPEEGVTVLLKERGKFLDLKKGGRVVQGSSRGKGFQFTLLRTTAAWNSTHDFPLSLSCRIALCRDWV